MADPHLKSPKWQQLVSDYFNVLPLIADAWASILVHCCLLLFFLWAIAATPSRPWTIYNWKQWVLLILFVGAVGSSGYAHYVLFQPHYEMETIGASAKEGEKAFSHQEIKKFIKCSPTEVFYYLMTVISVIVTHSIMRPWIGFGSKVEPWYKGIRVMVGLLISIYYAWNDIDFQTLAILSITAVLGRFVCDPFLKVLIYLTPFLGYLGILFIMSIWMVLDGILTAYTIGKSITKNAPTKSKTS